MQTEPIKILCCGDPGKDSIAEASKYAIDITVHEFSTVMNAVDPVKKNRIIELAKKKSTIVFTSKNAVAAVVEALGTIHPLWNIYCIGGPTQKEVTGYFGADKLKDTAINALELAKTIAENGVTEIVFFCGNLRRRELPEFLEHRNIGVEEIVVYDTVPNRKKLDDEYDGILFFSPSAVDTFFLDNTVSAKTIFLRLVQPLLQN